MTIQRTDLMKKNHIIVILVMAAFVVACSKVEPIMNEVSKFAGFKIPANFPPPAYNFANNMITEAGFELGKSLFYEGRLSRNNTISCGSCHIQSAAFTQHGHDVSHGIDDRLGTRNSPPIINLAWNTAFMWGGGVYDLDLQPIVPITAHEEMDENIANVMEKLRNTAKYPPMFTRAFGSKEITTARMMKALSQFMLMCVSSNAKYDRVMRKENGTTFTPLELEGYLLVKEKCASCHAEPLFTDNGFRNNGLQPGPLDDTGLYNATLKPADKYKFKVPSLRNLKYTAPYMHDGRFLGLGAVLDHYHAEVRPMATLDPLLQNGGIKLDATQRTKILAFLETLNDETFINNKLLAEQ